MQQSAATSGRVRLFGQAQSAEAYQIRDLLTRSVVGFDWVELTCDEDWTPFTAGELKVFVDGAPLAA